jgi:DNA-binding MarR family transcriptional regulator
VARLIDRLEARGAVERRPDPRDRRIWRLHLGPPSAEMLAEIAHQRGEITKMLLAGLDTATLRATTDALVAMKSNLMAARRLDPDPAPAASHPETV